MKVGELFQDKIETVADIVARELPAAHRAFAGRGLSDVEVLALAVSQQSRLVAEFRSFAEAAQTARIVRTVASTDTSKRRWMLNG